MTSWAAPTGSPQGPRALAHGAAAASANRVGAVASLLMMGWLSVVLWLDRADAVFMWAEPPVDERYRHATFVLDLLDPARTAVVNDPRGLRVCSEGSER